MFTLMCCKCFIVCVADLGNKLSIVFLLLAVNYHWCHCYRRFMINDCWCHCHRRWSNYRCHRINENTEQGLITSVNNTCGNLSLITMTLAIKYNQWRWHQWTALQIFPKIWNGPNMILKGLGGSDSWEKTWCPKSRVSLLLKTYNNHANMQHPKHWKLLKKKYEEWCSNFCW